LSAPIISARGLSKAYNLYASPRDAIMEAFLGGVRHDVFWALRDIDLDVHEGQRIGIIGPNGAGKSTLLKLIAGNLQQTSGTLEVHGRVSAMLSLTSFLDPERSGVDNIKFNLLLNGADRQDIPAMTEEIIDFTELGAFIYAPVRTYSSGMNARLSFAISTALTPDILVVDEVLGAGDAYFAAKATMRMIELCNRGRALLFVSHAMNAVQLLCDTAIWMDGGTIREIGPVEEIARRYEADFRRQEDESLRGGNAARSAGLVNKVLPQEIHQPDIRRFRLTGATGRVMDTHYVRKIEVDFGTQAHSAPIEFATLDEGDAAVLDVVHSEWGRLHARSGYECRTLAPSSRPLRGGHILIRPPVRAALVAQPVTFVVESTNLGKVEQLQLQYANPATGEWTPVEAVDRRKLGRGWEQATFSGVLNPIDPSDLRSHIEQIVQDVRPDVEILDVSMAVGGKSALSVREGVPFTISVVVTAAEEVPRCDVYLKIIRSDGFYVFWQSSGQVGQNLEDFSGTRRVTFEFDPNMFGAGDYEVTVEAANGFDVERNWPHSEIFDRRVNELKFTVSREWPLLMFGQINHRFPVTVETVDSEAVGDDIAPDEVELGHR
jgi:lipopolysaccharide transport system ATP-binding protein